ncbi:hypothetical protein [Pseudomonas sp. NPDC089569]|uniref:hypothetical protein n=1 Tax=Pseudomonas sp. NPDC089569 TaxID=3390722 RepID=UPI003D095841
MSIKQNLQSQQEANSAYLKMRSEYRAKVAEKEIIIQPEDFADSATKLLHGPKLKGNGGLNVYIPLWDALPPPTVRETVTLMIDRGSGNFETVGFKEFVIPAGETAFPEEFPYKMLISTDSLPENATCNLKYVHRSYQGDEVDSPITTFFCDRLPPYKHDPPAAPVFTGDFLDDDSLPVGGKLTVTIAGYPDWQATDQIAIYLVDEDNIPDDPTTTPPIFAGLAPAPGITDSTIEIDADTIRALGDTRALMTYALRDKALNPSPPAFYKKVSLTFGPLPTALKKPRVPQAVPGPLTMAHVRDGVSVWIDKFDNFKVRDEIRLKWGGQTLEDFPIPGNGLPNIEVPVLPALLMLTDYGQTTTGVKDTLVSYQVVRKGRPFGPESDTFKVNFEVALPWPDPWPPVDWPNPIHPDLLAGEVKNFDGTRTNQLTRADQNKDATFHFEWYAGAKNGQVVDFYWRGARVAEAQVTFDDNDDEHVPGGPYSVVIPWAYIKEGGNGDPVPVHYQVSGPGLVNDLHSQTTEVDVNAIAVELPPASFPSFAEQPVPEYPGCGALEPDGAFKFDDGGITVPRGRVGDFGQLRRINARVAVDSVVGTDGATRPLISRSHARQVIDGIEPEQLTDNRLAIRVHGRLAALALILYQPSTEVVVVGFIAQQRGAFAQCSAHQQIGFVVDLRQCLFDAIQIERAQGLAPQSIVLKANGESLTAGTVLGADGQRLTQAVEGKARRGAAQTSVFQAIGRVIGAGLGLVEYVGVTE